MHNIIFVLLRRLHLPLIALISVYAISVLGFVLIPGVDDQGNPWRMDFFHAFYFVSFMGTTIGFGELPYAFTDAQRLWTLVTIYGTVTAWLYGIGSLLATLQDQGIREQITASAFKRSIRRINEDFYLVCGYGDTGSMLVKALTEVGIKVVVIEKRQDRVNSLELEDLHVYVPGLCADANDPDNLILAGLNKVKSRRRSGTKEPGHYCIGVAALTNDDAVNLKIAITAKLLNPAATTIARAESKETESNMASFDTNLVINPFDVFAKRLAMALHSHGFYLLHELLTSVPHEVLTVRNKFPSHGKWLLCGYGRFGKAVYQKLLDEGLDVMVIEANPEMTTNLIKHVTGSGTEKHTLEEAGIEDAVGIVAGTDNDANNLSIIMTAKDANPDLYMVARQNSRRNDRIFSAESLDLDLVMRRGSTIAHTIFAQIRAPLLPVFLKVAESYDNDWANVLVSRISGLPGEQAPEVWEISLDWEKAPAVFEVLTQSGNVLLEDLYRDPREREQHLDCIPLLHYRTEHPTLLPGNELILKAGDRLLFCGTAHARHMMDWLLNNQNVLMYVLSGEEHVSSYLGRLLLGKKHAEQS